MKKLITLIFPCFLVFWYGVSQSQCPQDPWKWPTQSNWFIGNGLKGKFSGGTLTISSVPNIVSYEGTTGASDDNGNLLFLSNGRLLWDPAGTLKYSGLLEGNEGFMTSGSAAQGIITVRHPLDTARYYMFTTDDANQGVSNGLNYFSFDRSGNLLAGPVRLGTYRTSEGITATRHANGVDIWITAYASGTTDFYTYLLTCTGVVSTPVISGVAPVFSGQKERGGLAFSWDGKYFAQVHPDYSPNSDKEVSVYKFDNQTGIISDPHDISDPASGDSPYDVLFSPDNTKVYYSTATGTLGFYNITSWNTAVMSASHTQIAGVSTGSHSAIEIAGDGNLYMATLSSGLGKFTGSLNTGTLVYSNIAGAITNRGLPTMYLPPYEKPVIQPAGPLCVTDPPVNLSTLWQCNGLNAEDSLNNPNGYSGTGIINTWSGIFSPSSAGIGTHMVIFKKCNVSDTIYITVSACSCPDTSLKSFPPICAGDTVALNNYKITTQPGTWSLANTPAGSTAFVSGNIFYGNNTAPGKYTVRFTLDTIIPGCPDSAERTIIITAPSAAVAGTTVLCTGDSTTLTASGGVMYSWNNGATSAVITLSPGSTSAYSVVVTDANGCTAAATVTITVLPPPRAVISGEDTICSGKSTILTASGGANYLWNTAETTSSITVTPIVTTTYSVLISSGSCKDSSLYTVTVLPVPIAAVQGNATIKAGESILLSASGGGSYSWVPSDDLSCSNCPDPVASPQQTTTYCVYVSNTQGCTDVACLTITVINDCAPVYIPNAFSPNDDHENDILYVYGNCILEMRLLIYNRWGEMVFESTSPGEGWNGSFRGKVENPAVFAYTLTYKLIGDTGKKIIKKGNISLIR